MEIDGFSCLSLAKEFIYVNVGEDNSTMAVYGAEKPTCLISYLLLDRCVVPLDRCVVLVYTIFFIIHNTLDIFCFFELNFMLDKTKNLCD